jgi:hypothetical protein
MASTTNYGWSTPDDSAYVKDGASAIRTLGSAIDTSVKSLSPGTTAGDVDYYTSSTAKARLGIGAVGQVLTSTGSAPSWATPSGLDAMLTAETSTQYIKNLYGQGELNAAANTTYYMPIFLPTFSADRIGIRTGATTLGANGNVRIGLYNASLTTGKPTTVVFDAGTVSVTAASTDFQITISQNITAGWYYLAFNNQGSTTHRIVSGGTPGALTSYPAPGFNITAAGLTTTSPITGFTESSITGAFATAATISTITTAVPIVGMRIA